MKQLLQSINDFDQLLDFLRDELDWPVDDYELDELVFDYDVDELGLKPEEAEKLKGGKIRQLRPLAGEQPFGIFFVEFGKKKLPIVVLRRILSQLVIKKRANAAEAKRWDTADLLFISAFGEAGDREIAFAHFHKEPDSPELPILRVLGWDGSDTPLKLDYVERELKSRLNWPDDESDQDAWREQWRAAFRHKPGYVIKTASALAETLAEFAKKIRDAAATIIEHESEEKGHLRRLHRGFRDALIHDLSEEDFADTYAQTVTYGLLTAAVSRTDPSGVEGTALITENITDMVPVTNPFLKEMLEEFLKAGGRKGGIDFDELGIQDVVELLRDPKRTDLAAVLRDFGSKKQGEDPVIHFYEHFLAAYNKQLRIQRGVFYTPQPVVSYIVRSVHELLQTEFGLADGLADTTTWGEMVKKHPGLKLPPLTDEPGEKRTISPDEPFVQILDPATGTATFLVEVIEVIHRTLAAKWKQQRLTDAQQRAAWNDYVPQHLLPRLHAFELMMAPYAIAHMKIGLKLAETGYRFGTEERARIYLTNALEPWLKQLPLIGFDALAHEAAAVNEIKRHKRFTVVIGNPPYSTISQNMRGWISDLVNEYLQLPDGPIKEKSNRNHLQDDYVKFIRLAQGLVENTRLGLIGMITNNSYFSGNWHRGMRYHLARAFPKIRLVNLHGGKGFLRSASDEDENVFDIMQSVGLAFLARGFSDSHSVAYQEIVGSRNEKYGRLTAGDAGEKSILEPSEGNQWLFQPIASELQPEWNDCVSIDRVFVEWGAGVKTNRDGLATGFNQSEVECQIQTFADLKRTDNEVEEAYSFKSNYQWKTDVVRKKFAKEGFRSALVERYAHRPFDVRFIYWHPAIVFNMRGGKMECFRAASAPVALLFARNTTKESYTNFFVTRWITDIHCLETMNVAPLFTGITDQSGSNTLNLAIAAQPNFNRPFLCEMAKRMRLQESKPHGLPAGLTPEDIFHYAYAVFHSPGYRSRYAEFLKIDFPRLPLTGNLELFRALARLGGELTALHLLEAKTLDKPRTRFLGRNREVSKVGWTPDNGGTVWIDSKGTAKDAKPGTSGFAPVPEEVWNFHIGGYQVCHKWLKDRKGRTLTDEDITHYHKIVITLTETIRLMTEIDEVIEAHGGWPGAFQEKAVADS